jgi:hypothetical protein
MEQAIENYEESKVESVKRYLQTRVDKKHAETGESLARYYEIFVDNLKVVERTNDPEEFDSYADFLQDSTKEIRILIYTCSAKAPKLMTKYIFKLKPDEQKKEPGLSGTEVVDRIKEAISTERQKWEMEQLRKDLEATKNNSSLSGVEVQSKILEGVSSEMQKWELNQLKKELAQIQKELDDAEDYIDTLEKETESLRTKKGLEDLKSAETIGLVAEGMLRRNVHLLSKVPLAKGLAGVIASDNERRQKEEESTEPVSEASFKEKEKEPEPSALSQQMKDRIRFIQGMERAFKPEEFASVMNIMEALSLKKESIEIVKELLNIKK